MLFVKWATAFLKKSAASAGSVVFCAAFKYSVAMLYWVLLLFGQTSMPFSNNTRLFIQSLDLLFDKAEKEIIIADKVKTKAVLFFPEKLFKSILNSVDIIQTTKSTNAKDGTNRKRSPTLAPLIIKRLFVGEEARKKKKIQNDKMGIFRKRHIANTNKDA